ncbi:MAG: DUF6046 domain-containing protein [Candidatus Egerieousia sp.]
MITKYTLDRIAGGVLSGKMPPYFVDRRGRKVREVSENDFAQLSSMSDEQLSEYLRTNALGIAMTLPLEIRSDDSDWWLLPFEPLVSVSGKNVIIKKQVSKGTVRGSIKERWTQDDYDISISGILMSTASNVYPTDDVAKLRSMCEAAKLQVSGPLMEIFSISQIVVESFDFPFTTGAQNQAYTIKAVSDDMYKLLLKKEDLKV